MSCQVPSGPTPDQLTMVNFSAALFEHVLLRAGTPHVQAGPFMGRYVVQAGENRFAGKTQEEAIDLFLIWILLSPKRIEDHEEAERLLREAEERDTRNLIDVLASGGMSEYGRYLELERGDRKNRLFRAVVLAKSDPKKDRDTVEEIMPLLRDTALVDDATEEEVNEVLREYHKLQSG